MPRPVVIVNPQAAAGGAGRRWPSIRQAVEEALGPVEGLLTERPDHATELTRRALQQGAELVVAVGGDGALNEVVNGFFLDDQPIRPEAALGYVPLGTGGDFRRMLGAPRDPETAARQLDLTRACTVDVGKVRYTRREGGEAVRYFVNLASFGLGGEVSRRAKQSVFASRSGRAAFLHATAMGLLAYPGKDVRLRLDDGVEREYSITNVAIGNGGYHGGGMRPCPRAQLDDGLLEVTVIEKLGLLDAATSLPILYGPDIYRHPKVHHFRAKKLSASSDSLTEIEIDGESLGVLPLEVAVLPGALRLLTPQKLK